jgi:hypothetical protein
MKARKRKIEQDESREQIKKGQEKSTLLLSRALNAKAVTSLKVTGI